ncbi:MAG: alpha/beta hydrolase [Kofleriaceae bacterium]
MLRLTTVVVLAACASAPPPVESPAAAPPKSFAVTVTGHGPPVILIPGLSSSGETWDSTVAHLRGRYTCHVLTLAGFAGVPPIAGPLLPAVRGELARYITERRLDRPVVIGHSLGGALALSFAAEQPTLVGRIVIVDALPFLTGILAGAKTVDEARPVLEGMRKTLAGQTQPQYEAFVRSGMQTRSMVRSDADHARIIAWGLASDRTTVSNAMLDLLGTDLRPVLPRIAAPSLVIATWAGWGERDGTVETFRAQYVGLAGTQLVVNDTARHFVMLDEPAWWFAALDRFLEGTAAAVSHRSL